MLSHAFAGRRSTADPPSTEAARARLGRVVALPVAGWVPRDPGPDGGMDPDVDPATGSRPERRGPAHAATRRLFDRRAVAALAVLGVLSAALTGWYVWRSWPVSADAPVRSEVVATGEPTSAPETPGASPAASAGSPAAGSSTAAGSPGPATSRPATLVVHVAGAVTRPGIVTVPTGARVADAIDAAGGPLPGTDMSSVNLARLLMDGEQVVVGLPPTAAAPPAGAPTASSAGADGGPLDLNAATLDQLQDLPGVGPVLAQRIVEWRTANGRFSSVEELQEVSGIGEQRLAELRDHVRV